MRKIECVKQQIIIDGMTHEEFNILLGLARGGEVAGSAWLREHGYTGPIYDKFVCTAIPVISKATRFHSYEIIKED